MKAFLLILSLFLVGSVQAQTDTSSQSSGYFLTFVKKVYLNPTVYLRCQQFKETTNIGFVALPDLNSAQNNASSGFEKGLQKLLRLLMQTDGGIRFYFNPDTPTAPFSFWSTDNLWCKFQQPQKDSINYYLNHNFSDGNLDLNNNQRFENTIDETLDYIQRVLAANTASCGDEPQNETTTINTKPLAINLHNTSGSKYDIDYKQYDALASNYAVATDVFTNQEWYAPSKMFVAGGGTEPVVMSINLHDPQFKKENLKIEILRSHTVLQFTYSNDSVRFNLPSDLVPSDPVEVVVKYKSLVDSVNYTVGLFMINVVEQQTPKLILLGANGYSVSPTDVANIKTYLDKVYKPVGVSFEVSSDAYVFPNDYPTMIQDEGSGLLSNYPSDLHDFVGDVKDLDDYDSDNYYLVLGLNNSNPNLKGYMPRARNIGFIFFSNASSNYSIQAVAHEIGHGTFHFRHIFDEEELGSANMGMTHNLMDYSTVLIPEALYLHQWNFIMDPAFVSWFGGDDEDASIVESVPYRCLPASIAKKYNVESYRNISGNIVQLNTNQAPYAFAGSGSEYEGSLIMLTQDNTYYFSCQNNEEYPWYYKRRNPNQSGLDVSTQATIGKNQNLSPTIVIIDEDCNYIVKRPNEANVVGKTDNCICNSNVPKPIVVNYDYAIGPLPEQNNKVYSGSPNSFSCDKFVLSVGKFAKLPSEIVSSITSFELTEDSRLHSFTINNKKYINAVWGAKKKNSNESYQLVGGSEYFICFQDLENLFEQGVSFMFTGDQMYFIGADLTANYSKKIKDADLSFYKVGEQAIQVLGNGSIGCGPAPMTLSILENSILNCNLTACMSGLYDYMTYENLKKFKSITQDHILDYMFRNVQVEHPYATDPYGDLNIKNMDDKYVLMDLIKAFADNGRLEWFYETFLMDKNNISQINLQKIATGLSDVNFKCEFSNKLFEYLNNPGTKKFNSPLIDFKDSRNQTISFPASVNTVIPYYENWLQTSNTFVVKSEKCNVVVKADEFDFRYENGLIKIEQSGTYNIFKTYTAPDAVTHKTDTTIWTYQVLTKLVDAGVDFDQFINNETYNDSYYLHPYDMVSITLGKAIPELDLKEGQTLTFPAFFVTVLGQYGEDKVSTQNFQIFMGVVAVASAVFTGGASIAALSTSAGTMTVTALTGEVLTIGLGVVTTGFDVADLYFTATDGNQNLTPEELKFRQNVSKAALYLNMLEVGVGGFTALRKLVKLGSAAEVVSDLMKSIDEMSLTTLKAEINLLDPATKAKFLDEFAGASKPSLQAMEDNIDLFNYWKTNGQIIKNNKYPANAAHKVWEETKATIVAKADPTEVKILNAVESSPPPGNKVAMAGAYSPDLPNSSVVVKYNNKNFDVSTLQPELKQHLDYLSFIKKDFDNGGTLYKKLYTNVPDYKIQNADIAGTHAEVLAANEVIIQLKAAGKFNGIQDLSKIQILVKGRSSLGNMCRCPHCFQILSGAKMIGNT